MNKDILVASIIGFSLGLIGALALWVVPKILPNLSKLHASPSPSANVETLENQPVNLEITSVKDGDIVKDETLSVDGKATKLDYLILNTFADQQILKPTEGTFSATLKLNEGGNQIVVTGYNQSSQVSKNLFVYYFSDKL